MITAIIPARGGSKRLPGKNLQRIGGSTLVELAIRCAQEVDEIDVIAVSTDDAEIAAEAFRCGAVVIPRPAELATDDATSEEVALHALKMIDADTDDTLVWLQPTSPLRTAGDVKRALALSEDQECGVYTVARWSEKPNGAVYVVEAIEMISGEFGSGLAMEMDADRSIDIDTPEDLARAQEWWARRAVA